jgi:hypothetical protein
MFFPATAREENEIRPLLEMMCLTCPVYDRCFDYALRVQVDGYWAGTTESDRKQLRAESNIVAESLSNDVRSLFGSNTASSIKRRKAN